jgi:hypothetical protein
MAAPTTAATAWEWPADVLAFAAERQVQSYLEPLLEVTRQVFPTAPSITIYVDEDPEILDDRHIVFEVHQPCVDANAYVERQRRWNDEAFRRCPPALICWFRLCLIAAAP